MSTIAFAQITNRRDASPKGKSKTEAPPAMKTYVDTLAALVPAEVLAIHATLLGFMTETEKSSQGTAAQVITDDTHLTRAFWGLMALSAVLYLGFRGRSIDRWDAIRTCIPPLAFAGWCMIQKTTAFDAAFDWSMNARYTIGLIGAPVLALLATGMAYKADDKGT